MYHAGKKKAQQGGLVTRRDDFGSEALRMSLRRREGNELGLEERTGMKMQKQRWMGGQ